MTIRDVMYGNDIEVEANIRIAINDWEKDEMVEYNPDDYCDRNVLDQYLDSDISYISIRKLSNSASIPYIYMEASIFEGGRK